MITLNSISHLQHILVFEKAKKSWQNTANQAWERLINDDTWYNTEQQEISGLPTRDNFKNLENAPINEWDRDF
jgi:hypothetical protein